MRLTLPLFALALIAAVNAAQALEIQPYSPQAFAARQQANETVALHFHADWCPTCRAQERVFKGWQGDAAVPGTLLVVDYDKERALKKQMGVRGQSTLIVFKGAAEQARLAGETDAEILRRALAAGR